MFHNNWIALVLTLALALLWLRFMDHLAARGVLTSRTSRKIIHIGTGPIFVLCWLLFNDAPSAKFLAALIPLAITMQFAAVGLGIIKDPAAVAGMSRSGNRNEILRGPLFYGIIFVLLTILYWKQPAGIIALMMLCGGDGIADIIGQRQPRIFLPWSKSKTLFGSIGVLIGGILLSLLILAVYSFAGYLPEPITPYFLPVCFIGFVVALVESLPVSDIDNITVPLVALLAASILL